MPRRIVYDNTKLAVARILGDGTRQRTQVFSELQSHYLFAARFGRPGKGNDKGKVEGLVGYVRRNFFVPVPRFGSWDALNAALARQCHERRGRRLRRHTETIGERFARHRRSYEREVLIFEPRHYLALLERKTGALDQAAPLAAWRLPDEFLRLRRLLEARLGKPGTREYVQVLRLLEDFRLDHVSGAIRDAVRLGAIGFDAVKHLVRCRLDHRPPQLDLARYPHLPAAHVATTAATDYLALLGAGAE